ncbi:MAG: endonuclease/exonuclease/phosphatase (EEP) superfamily protein YafD [Paracoccaceae bacterium]
MILFWAVAVSGFVVLALSYAGAVTALGDSLSVIRPVVGLAGVLWIAGGWWLSLAHWGWLGVVVASILPDVFARFKPGRHVAPEGSLRLYQKNMSFGIQDSAQLEADIRAVSPDIVTLQEVSPNNRKLLEQLRDVLPYQAYVDYAPVGGVAVASRLPMSNDVPVTQVSGVGLVMLRVQGPQGPFWAGSIHLPWPWPFDLHLHLESVLKTLAPHTGPFVIAGDFNMVPVAHVFRRLTRATGTYRAGRARASFRMWRGRIGLALDHALIPRGVRAQTELRPDLGSDHKGLVVRFYPPINAASKG